MDILLIGGSSSVMDAIINKLNKEGHRVYVLSANKYRTVRHKSVFEQYYFAYDNDCIKEVFDSVNPDVTIFTGIYDTNFDWDNARKEAVRYTAGLLNMLTAFSMQNHGRFIYLSSEEVYNQSYPNNIEEEENVMAQSFRAMAVSQGENMCINYQKTVGLDTVVLRLDHLYAMPEKKDDTYYELCVKMCIEAIQTGKIVANANHIFSMIYLSDAVELIYKVVVADTHKEYLYHISSVGSINEMELAQIIQRVMGAGVAIENNTIGEKYRIVLSNHRYDKEFRIFIFHNREDTVKKIAVYIKRHAKAFLNSEDVGCNFWERLCQKTIGIIRAIIPFIENLICFIPFFMLNNRAVGSEYFANLDFYLLYVLLFAIVYGQQQATFAAIMAVAGYCFRQMYQRTGFEVLLDYNTYVWIAQLFILGMAVGYMRDRLKAIKGENDIEVHYLSNQLDDIQDINTSNVRMKNVLEAQIVNQNDSIGKIYDITSSLDKYEAEEVLFYAAEVLSKLINSKDIAIYTVENHSYARLFSSTSANARVLGNSIQYTELEDMYGELKEQRVYINKTLDERYPLMANAIYAEDRMQLILMIWGIPWERMTLSQANMLIVIGYLIQNAVIRANRYLEALENKRYIEGTHILESNAFRGLTNAYIGAREKSLTQCTILQIVLEESECEEAGIALYKMLRQSDYMGKLENGKLYVLLSNTDGTDAEYVMKRFQEAGYQSMIKEKL